MYIYIYIIDKKNQNVLIWRYQRILVMGYKDILIQKHQTRKIHKDF